MKTFFLLLPTLFLSLLIDGLVVSGYYSVILPVLWGVSLLLFIFIFLRKKSLRIPKMALHPHLILVIFAVLLPSAVRIANYDLTRLHGDDAVTAYISATEDFSRQNFFGGFPSDKVQWVCQFPAVFFLTSKIFFRLFGTGFLTVKLSVIPYVIIVSVMLYLLVKFIFGIKPAFITLFVYSFFAPSLYLETLGLHFISSTAVFLVFIYLLLRYLKNNSALLSALTGLICGLCYLFYSSSYIAFPLMITVFILQLVKARKTAVWKYFLIALIGFSLVMGPFTAYAGRFGNYFTSRTGQVSLLSGSWSNASERIKKGESAVHIVRDNLLLSVKSLYLDNIGGHGGYNFGHMALFDKVSFVLFILGLTSGIIVAFKKIGVFLIIFVVCITFITGMVLTVPPPAFHRFSLAFPFICIILSIPLTFLISLKRIPAVIRSVLAVAVLVVYILHNRNYFLKTTATEHDNRDIAVAAYINKNYPGRNLYIASFPGYVFEKTYYFSPGKNALRVKTAYHNDLLAQFNPQEKYIYLIIFPGDFNNKFLEKDPAGGKIIPLSQQYGLFVN